MTAALTAVAFTPFAELFVSRVRYRIMALGLNLASVAAGGTAPYIAIAFINWTGNPLSAAYFLMASAVITLIGSWSLTEIKGSILAES